MDGEKINVSRYLSDYYRQRYPKQYERLYMLVEQYRRCPEDEVSSVIAEMNDAIQIMNDEEEKFNGIYKDLANRTACNKTIERENLNAELLEELLNFPPKRKE